VKEGHLAISTLAHVGGSRLDAAQASTRTRRGAAVFATDFATQLSGSGLAFGCCRIIRDGAPWADDYATTTPTVGDDPTAISNG
jgi:hypothetical protein